MRRADLAYETTPDRCRRCSKLLLVDVGGDYFGRVTGAMFCPHCGEQPEAVDWVRAAVAEVVGRTGFAR